MDRLESMSILLAAVEGGSLSAAGRRRGIPLATVSRKISDLEAHLGTTLLRRTSRKLELTDAGRSYALACKRILEDVGEAERAAAGEYSEPRGDLTITAPIVFGRLHVLPVVADFIKTFPEINVRLAQADRAVNLLEEHIDLAIRIGALPDSSLIAARLGEIRRIVCGSPAYFAARGAPSRPDELNAHDCVSYDALTAPEGWVFRAGNSEIYAAGHCRLRVNTTEAAIAAAVAGVGVTRVLCYQTAEAVATDQVQFILEDFEPAPWPVSLIYPAQQLLPLKLRAFLDFATPRLRERLRLSGDALNAKRRGARHS